MAAILVSGTALKIVEHCSKELLFLLQLSITELTTLHSLDGALPSVCSLNETALTILITH